MTILSALLGFAMSLALAGGLTFLLLEGLFRMIGASAAPEQAPMGD